MTRILPALTAEPPVSTVVGIWRRIRGESTPMPVGEIGRHRRTPGEGTLRRIMLPWRTRVTPPVFPTVEPDPAGAEVTIPLPAVTEVTVPLPAVVETTVVESSTADRPSIFDRLETFLTGSGVPIRVIRTSIDAGLCPSCPADAAETVVAVVYGCPRHWDPVNTVGYAETCLAHLPDALDTMVGQQDPTSDRPILVEIPR